MTGKQHMTVDTYAKETDQPVESRALRTFGTGPVEVLPTAMHSSAFRKGYLSFWMRQTTAGEGGGASSSSSLSLLSGGWASMPPLLGLCPSPSACIAAFCCACCGAEERV